MSKIKVVNPFSLISSFLPKKKEEPVYEIEVDDKPKKKKRGSFDFEEVVKECGFSFVKFKDGYSSYRCVAIPELYLIWNTQTNSVSIIYEKKLLSKTNFLPNNRIFTEIFIKKTIENL